jgi:N6-adenosine-specific RNA methylase IME4
MKYRTIVADPPWPYEAVVSSPSSRRDNPRGDGVRVVSPFPYSTMAVDEIAAVPVSELAERDCRLFLWTTSRFLSEGLTVGACWGFTYRQAVVWHKTGNPSPLGGSVAPNHAEFLLVFHLGSPPRLQRWSSSVVSVPAPQCGKHSTKPDAFADLIEQVSAGPYLELFARRQRLGWDTWGDEALNHVELSA